MKKKKSTPKPKITKSALADMLGISRQALNAHLRNPDAPKIDDLTGWQIFLAAHGRIGTIAPAGKYREAICEQRLAVLRETARKLQFENDVTAKKLVNYAEVRRQSAQAVAIVHETMNRWMQELPPILVGLTASEIHEVLKKHKAQARIEWDEKFEHVGTDDEQ